MSEIEDLAILSRVRAVSEPQLLSGDVLPKLSNPIAGDLKVMSLSH